MEVKENTQDFKSFKWVRKSQVKHVGVVVARIGLTWNDLKKIKDVTRERAKFPRDGYDNLWNE